MLFNKKNTLWSLLLIPFKIFPMMTLVTIVQKTVDAILPTVNVLIVAYFINTATDIFYENTSSQHIYLPLLCIVSVLAFQIFFDTLIEYFVKKMRIRLKNKIDSECLDRQASLSFEYIDNSESYMLVKKVFGELSSHINTIYNTALNIASVLIRFSSIMIVFILNGLWWIGILFVLISIPMMIVSYSGGKNIYHFYKENFPGQMKMYHYAYILKDRSVADERTLFGFSKIINKQWKELQMDLYKKKSKINTNILTNRYLAQFINLLCVIIIISFMTYSIFKGRMDVGLYIALVINIIMLVEEVIATAIVGASTISQEKEFLKDLNIVCSYKYDSSFLCQPNKKHILVDTIEFRNVSFAYPGTDRKVLNNVSFKIKRGVHYAFVGQNGAGKSTIIKLLTRLYDNYSGEILINEKNIKDYSYSDIKAMIGIIYQDFSKYELSLKDNVQIGDINALHKYKNDEKLFKIIDSVGLTELLKKLPQKEMTLLGKSEETGQDISGGEWQRIAIARLMMKDSDFMILDEPTASLDPIAESKLYELFSSISKNKTTLLISHRLGSVKTVDYIYVIDNGFIVECGSHTKLMHKKGLYYKLYSEQKGWYT